MYVFSYNLILTKDFPDVSSQSDSFHEVTSQEFMLLLTKHFVQ